MASMITSNLCWAEIRSWPGPPTTLTESLTSESTLLLNNRYEQLSSTGSGLRAQCGHSEAMHLSGAGRRLRGSHSVFKRPEKVTGAETPCCWCPHADPCRRGSD